MVVVAFIGGMMVGAMAGVLLIALCVSSHNSNYRVEELHREEDPDEAE